MSFARSKACEGYATGDIGGNIEFTTPKRWVRVRCSASDIFLLNMKSTIEEAGGILRRNQYIVLVLVVATV